MPEDFARRSVLLTPESPWICWSFLTIDLICSVTNSCSASSLTFRRRNRRIVSTCFLSSSGLKKSSAKADSICPHDESSLPVLQIDLAILWNVIWNMIFMIWKKCQNMLRWSGQNANQKVGTDKMPTTEISPDKMPTFGWHYVRLAFCPHPFFIFHYMGSLRRCSLPRQVKQVGPTHPPPTLAGKHCKLPNPRRLMPSTAIVCLLTLPATL